ncbi:MAG: hypothetical protein P4L90_01185 [Rhodopila sp.]|nr:hypothetical protein [Rhodopila sp.]
MVGITLSPEQITQAPPEVRRWLEQQVASALGLYRPEPPMRAPERHLVACDPEQAQAILSLIQGILPVVSVFFELGREPVATSPQGLRALRLDEMTRHARLQTPEQVIACLKAIDEALQRVIGRPDALLTALDDAGHCLVADATARSILSLWQEIVAARELTQPDRAPVQAAPYPASAPFQSPYAITMPTFTAGDPAGNAGSSQKSTGIA